MVSSSNPGEMDPLFPGLASAKYPNPFSFYHKKMDEPLLWLVINTMSAKYSNSSSRFSSESAYAKVSLGGDPATIRWTRVDDGRGGNFYFWDDPLIFPIDEEALDGRCLLLKIKSKRFLGDREVGRVQVALKDIFHATDAAQGVVEYQLRRRSGYPRGTLQFTYKFWDDGAITAHPVPPGVGMGMPYAQPAGYGCPAQPAYVHPPPPYGYAPQPTTKRNIFGRLGACLLLHGMFSEVEHDADDADFGFY